MKYHKKWLTTVVLAFFICFLIQQYWMTGANYLAKFWFSSQPFLVGAAIAYVVNLVMRFYETIFDKISIWSKISLPKRPLSLLLAYATFISLIVWIFSIVIPDLIFSINSLSRIDTRPIQEWLTDLYENPHVANFLSRMGVDSDLPTTISRYSQQILNQVLVILTSLMTSVSGIASTILNVFVSLIFSIYVLGNKEQLHRQVKLLSAIFLGQFSKPISYVVGILNKRFSGFLISQTLEAMILGTLTALGMSLLKFPYVGTVGVLVAFTAILPVIGAYIGTTVGMILIATQSFQQALWFFVFMVILQQIEGNLIYPKVVGGSIGLPGMWVLMSIAVGGSLGGLFGMICAVPVAATLYQILKDTVHRKHS